MQDRYAGDAGHFLKYASMLSAYQSNPKPTTRSGPVTRLTKEERLDRLTQDSRRRLDSLDELPACLSSAPRSRLRVLVEKAGYRNATESVLDRIDVSLKSVRVGTFPELTDPTVSREHWIKFYDLDHPIEGLQPHRVLFNVESELEAFIVANFKAMNFFRARRYGLIGRQARISPTCTIDLLAEHRRTRELVGIELKAEEPDDRLLAQVNRYLPALAARAERDQRPSARLLVISGQPDHAIVRACADSAERAGVALEWHLYRVNVGIKTVDGLGHSHRGPRKGGLGHDSR